MAIDISLNKLLSIKSTLLVQNIRKIVIKTIVEWRHLRSLIFVVSAERKVGNRICMSKEDILFLFLQEFILKFSFSKHD